MRCPRICTTIRATIKVMFPIRDHNPSGRVPFVTYGLIGINVLIFLYTFYLSTKGDVFLVDFYGDWAMQPVEIMDGTDMHTLITSMFLHGGWMHLIGNMLFLYVFGDNLEGRLHHLGFLAFYIIGGLAATGVQLYFNQESEIFNIGASGAIAAVLGGYILLWPKAKIDVMVTLIYIMRRMSLPAWIMLGYWFGLQLFQSFASLGATEDVGGVAYWAHAGGFVAGLLMIIPFWLMGKGKSPTMSPKPGGPVRVKSHTRKTPSNVSSGNPFNDLFKR